MVGFNVNDKILPLAFALVEEEINFNKRWFLDCI
jgi:hypothetical protein